MAEKIDWEKRCKDLLDNFVRDSATENSMLCNIYFETDRYATNHNKLHVWIHLRGDDAFPKSAMFYNWKDCYKYLEGFLWGIYAGERLQLKFRNRKRVPVKQWAGGWGWEFKDVEE